MREWQPLGSDGADDDGLRHRHRLEHLDLDSAPEEHGHHGRPGSGQIGPHVVDRAGHDNVLGIRLRKRRDLRRRPAADDGEAHVRYRPPDAGQDLIDEERHGVLIRLPVHRAGEYEAGLIGLRFAGREVFRVDAGRQSRDVLDAEFVSDVVGVGT